MYDGPRRRARRPAGRDLAAAVRVRRRRDGPRFMANPELLDAEGEIDRGGGLPVDPGPVPPDTPRRDAIRCRGLRTSHGDASRARRPRVCSRGSSSTRPTTSTGCSTSIGSTTTGARPVLAELRRIELGLAEPRASSTHDEVAAMPAPVTVRVAFLGNDPWSVPAARGDSPASRDRRGAGRHEPAEGPRVGRRLRADRGRGRRAARSALPLVEAEGVARRRRFEALRGAAPDVIVVVAYGEILVARRPHHAPPRRGEPALLAAASMARCRARPARDPGR